jgi:DNA-binding IclR family transcriptional regulator
MAGNSTEAGRSVTNKITSILMTFTEGSEHTLTEISQLAHLPISTAHRLTSELASWRLLERTDDGHYRVGLPLRMISTGDAAPPSVAERAPWVLEDLSAATRSRARLGVLSGLEVAYIEKQPGHRPVSCFSAAATLPAHPTALGRALLAFSGADLIEATLARGLRPYTPHTVTSPDRFRRALAVTRLSRVAVTRWELEAGVSGVAMPVFGPGGDVVGAIELAVTDLGRELQSVMAALSVASRRLPRELASDLRRVRAVSPAVSTPQRPDAPSSEAPLSSEVGPRACGPSPLPTVARRMVLPAGAGVAPAGRAAGQVRR